MILIICDFSYEILYESSIHLFFKSKENMGELRDAAFASCWRSAALETKQIWTWVCSCSIIYCVDCFIFKSGWGQGIYIFLATHSILSYCLLFFSVFFLFFKFSVQSYVPRCPGTGNVLIFFDVLLYFHSCGIVGIMTVMIKLAHLFLLFLWIVCWMWALGFVFRREDSITPDEVL